MKKVFFGFLLIVCVISGFLFYLALRYPTTSPFRSIVYVFEAVTHPHLRLNKEIIGFLPYWRTGDIQYVRFDSISEVNYFSLSFDRSGNIDKVTGNETDPGWLAWEKQDIKDLIAKTQISGNSFSLTIAESNNKTIESLLNSKKSQQNLIKNILDLVRSNNLDGIIVDFEYDGKPDFQYKNEFTKFLTKLSSELRSQSPHTTLDLALLPMEGRRQGLFDIPRLVPNVHHFIGMTYNYYGDNSDIAGPGAPMRGFAEKKYFFDVITAYEDYLKFIPKEKVIMGIPYYGWDWAVKDGKQIQSETLDKNDPNNYAAVLSYARMREEKYLKKDQCEWDDYAQEEWCWYTDEKGIDHQVWYENNRSIGVKFAYAKKSNFAGTALWVLGYDKGYQDLWNIIKKYNDKNYK